MEEKLLNFHLYQLFINSVSSLYQFCINFVSTLCQLCINFVLTLYQLCINFVSILHQLCINFVSTLYQLSINFVSTSHGKQNKNKKGQHLFSQGTWTNGSWTIRVPFQSNGFLKIYGPPLNLSFHYIRAQIRCFKVDDLSYCYFIIR